MWHRKSRRRLGVVREHRKALLRNLVNGLVENNRIQTTYPKAKEASRMADKAITIAKRGTLHARRQLVSKLASRKAAKRLVDEIAPAFKDQAGGYTRVLRTQYRAGDGAQLALLEFTRVIEKKLEQEKEKKEKKKGAEPQEKAVKEPKPEKPEKKPEKKAEKPVQPKKEPEAAEEPKQPEAKKDVPLQEEPKKGGFLSNLRKFLTGD